jgi:uncharacterized protein (TIGR03435 family)
VGRSVIDKTGFKGRFDVDLKFDSCNAAVAVGEIPPASSTCADPSSYSSISAGLQEQLGLRLQSTKGPVEVLIIDHAEKPTAN